VRSLQPAELTWFMARSIAFIGHVDPHGVAQRMAPLVRDTRRDAASSFIWQTGEGAPRAGIVAMAPDPDDDERTLRMAQPWFDGDAEDLVRLVTALCDRFDHEAVVVDLVGVPPHRVEQVSAALAGEGFDLDVVTTLRFALADVPPLGRPLTLEAWRPGIDAAARELVSRSEGWSLSDARWAWCKRAYGPFRPDLWFVASEAPDRPALGYALCGARTVGVEATIGLIAAGVAPEHRTSTEMLKRLVLTLLHELAGVHPLGRLETTLSGRDPKLIEIMRSLGFGAEAPRAQVRRLPS
jgi:hypothetical protein